MTLRKSFLQLVTIGLSASIAPFMADALQRGAMAHGAAGGEEHAPGEFTARPVITIEGHGGLENNLKGQPQHYAVDAMAGGVLEWGLPNNGSFAVEAQIGAAAVWGEAEHFYGLVHVEEHKGKGHHEDEHEGEEHAGEEHEGEEHAEAGHSDHGHSDGAPYKRTDLKGYLQVRYEPNQQLALSATWKPYFVTRDQGEEKYGLKNEVEFGAIYAFGDGDVNFALGDGLEDVVNGLFISAKNATGWESDGLYVGNYTDLRPGFGFSYDQLNVTLSAGPRFYVPGDYAKLPSRTDWGGELELEYPIGSNAVLFAHWEPMYSTQGGEGWGKGFQHHIGTGVSFSF